MTPLDFDVLQHARSWLDAGHKLHLITVAETFGSAPRQPGALLIVRDDGRAFGSVSGGCVEDDLIEKAKAGTLPARAEPVTYGITRDEGARFGLPCGGTLRLIAEPVQDAAWLDPVLTSIQQKQLIKRTLDLETGAATLAPAVPTDIPQFDGRLFQTVYGPRWRLLIIGANQTAKLLCDIAQALDFQVTVCDPREEFFADWHAPQAALVTTMPDDTVVEMATDDRTAVIAVTHDPKLDDMALLEALKSRAFYVGALGSRANQAKRRERLRMFDLSDEEIARLRGPVGLKIASRTPAEIAVAIAAELILVRNTLGEADDVGENVAQLVRSQPATA